MSAKVIPCDTGTFRFRGRSGPGEFAPSGAPIVHRGARRGRAAGGGDDDDSFMVQKGIYKHKAGGDVVREDSVRVIILHVTDETIDAFKEHIIALGERLVADLRQEEVIVEFQSRGVTDEVIGITA